MKDFQQVVCLWLISPLKMIHCVMFNLSFTLNEKMREFMSHMVVALLCYLNILAYLAMEFSVKF